MVATSAQCSTMICWASSVTNSYVQRCWNMRNCFTYSRERLATSSPSSVQLTTMAAKHPLEGQTQPSMAWYRPLAFRLSHQGRQHEPSTPQLWWSDTQWHLSDLACPWLVAQICQLPANSCCLLDVATSSSHPKRPGQTHTQLCNERNLRAPSMIAHQMVQSSRCGKSLYPTNHLLAQYGNYAQFRLHWRQIDRSHDHNNQMRFRSVTTPPATRTMSAGAAPKLSFHVPAAAHTSSYCNKSGSTKTRSCVLWPKGGTPSLV